MVGENAATANSFLFLVSVGLSQSGLLSPIPIEGRHLVEEELTNGDVERLEVTDRASPLPLQSG